MDSFLDCRMVIGTSGYKPVEDVMRGESAATETVVPVMRGSMYDGAVYGVQSACHPHPTRCTADCHFYVRRRSRKRTSGGYQYTMHDPDWVAASDLSDGDFCGLPINQASHVPMGLEHPARWFFMGYFLGSREASREAVLKLIGAIWSDNESAWLEQFTDNIPEWVQDAPATLVRSFLQGYNRACGCVSDSGTMGFKALSYGVALAIQRLHLKLGTVTRVCYHALSEENGFYTIVATEPMHDHGFIGGDHAWFRIDTLQVGHGGSRFYHVGTKHGITHIVENMLVKIQP